MTRVLYVWVIAHINKDLIQYAQKDIKKNLNYKGVIEISIPTVRVLKKQFKNKPVFDEVPLLFNYGFVKVPLTWAINQDIMDNIRRDIGCISHWVTDPMVKNPKTPKKTQNSIQLLKQIKYAYVRGKEVQRMMRIAENSSIHSSKDIANLKPGKTVTLVGYPFEGMDAEIVQVDKAKSRVIVAIQMFSEIKEVSVSLDNVLYTIYRGDYDEEAQKESAIKDYQETNYTGNEEY